MTWVRNQRLIRLWLVALYALSMALLGFAHTAPPQPTKIDLAAYVLPDGSLPSICLNSGADSDAPYISGPACEACLLTTASGMLPCREEIPAVGVVIADISFESAEDLVSVYRHTHVPHLRGPPAVFAAL